MSPSCTSTSSTTSSSPPADDLDLAPPATRLRALAFVVERLGTAGRCDPEVVVLTKLMVAAQMRRIARELDR